MAAAIREQLGIESTVTPASAGVFDVVVDGQTIFSKQQTGRFPKNTEIISALRAL